MKTVAQRRPLVRAMPAGPLLDGLAERLVRQRLSAIEHGELTIDDGAAAARYGSASESFPLSESVRVRDRRFFREVALGGAIGAAEAYMEGYWSASDLTNVMRILLQNRAALDGMETGWARLAEPARKLLHWASRNTRHGSRRNIHAHYDLGNDFFKLFLDPTLMYSSAIFERDGMPLEQASIVKLDRICRKLELTPGDRVIEIGTGWGGFALHAARHYGCHVTTTTISSAQFELARERIADAGLAHRVTLLRDDYRDLTGRYDKLVSIEMIEAVGHQYYESFFGKCGDLLEPHGAMLLQAITIADQRYEAARRSVDFIQRYIFPGSCIPSVTALCNAITRASDLRLCHLEDIGPHYATTLRHWRRNFNARLDEVRAMGYPETFIRMWNYYLCYCEAGFLERALGDAQMLLVKPSSKIRSW